MSAMSPSGEESSKVFADFVNFGKLVISPDGPIPPEGIGGGVTSRSRGIAREHGLLFTPSGLLKKVPAHPDEIDLKCRERGFLVIKRVDVPDSSGQSISRIALMRARFRPEAGEGQRGRRHLQATTWVVQIEDWLEASDFIVTRAIENLVAKPDLIANSPPARFDISALDIGAPPQNVGYDRNPNAVVPEGVLTILALTYGIMKGVNTPPVGAETYPGGEVAFLKSVAAAVRHFRMIGADPAMLPDVTVGVLGDIAENRIRFLPSKTFDSRNLEADKAQVEGLWGLFGVPDRRERGIAEALLIEQKNQLLSARVIGSGSVVEMPHKEPGATDKRISDAGSSNDPVPEPSPTEVDLIDTDDSSKIADTIDDENDDKNKGLYNVFNLSEKNLRSFFPDIIDEYKGFKSEFKLYRQARNLINNDLQSRFRREEKSTLIASQAKLIGKTLRNGGAEFRTLKNTPKEEIYDLEVLDYLMYFLGAMHDNDYENIKIDTNRFSFKIALEILKDAAKNSNEYLTRCKKIENLIKLTELIRTK